MKLNVLAFGIARDLLGGRNLEIVLSDGSSTADLRLLLESRHPALKDVLRYAIAVNQQYIHDDVMLSEKDEVAVIPPVSGG